VSTARDENAALVTSNVVAQESISDDELERSVTNVETGIQNAVELSNNKIVTNGSVESPVSANQLHSMLDAFMTAMQAENAKLASNLESKLNKLSENLDAKLASVCESLDTELNLVSDSLNAKLNSMIANVTSEIRQENDQMRQEFKTQLQTEVQSITKEMEVVRKSTDMELTNCVRNVESVCDGMNESMNTHKFQTDASVNSLRLETNQNKEEVKNKVGELTLEIRSVAFSLDECNSTIQTDRQVYQAEIQKLNLEIENLRTKVNNNQTNQTASAVCTSPQTSTTIRVIDIGQPTSQVSSGVSESGSHISPGVNGVSVCNAYACNNVNHTNTIATSCIETSVDTSQYKELSLPKFSDSSKQVAVHFIRELDEYFTLRKTPEELRRPLVFRSISDPFAKHWMLTTYGQLKSYDDFKKAFTELL
jgi:hypothetical protein